MLHGNFNLNQRQNPFIKVDRDLLEKAKDLAEKMVESEADSEPKTADTVIDAVARGVTDIEDAAEDLESLSRDSKTVQDGDNTTKTFNINDKKITLHIDKTKIESYESPKIKEKTLITEDIIAEQQQAKTGNTKLKRQNNLIDEKIDSTLSNTFAAAQNEINFKNRTESETTSSTTNSQNTAYTDTTSTNNPTTDRTTDTTTAANSKNTDGTSQKNPFKKDRIIPMDDFDSETTSSTTTSKTDTSTSSNTTSSTTNTTNTQNTTYADTTSTSTSTTSTQSTTYADSTSSSTSQPENIINDTAMEMLYANATRITPEILEELFPGQNLQNVNDLVNYINETAVIEMSVIETVNAASAVANSSALGAELLDGIIGIGRDYASTQAAGLSYTTGLSQFLQYYNDAEKLNEFAQTWMEAHNVEVITAEIAPVVQGEYLTSLGLTIENILSCVGTGALYSVAMRIGMDTFVETAPDTYGNIWDNFKEQVSLLAHGDIIGYCKNMVIDTPAMILENGWNFTKSLAKNTYKTVTDIVKTAGEGVYNTGKTYVTGEYEVIKTKAEGVVDGVKKLLSGDVVGAAKTIITSLANSSIQKIKTIVETAWEGIKGVINTFNSIFGDPIETVWNFLKTIAENAGDIAGAVWKGIKNAASAVGNAVGNAVSAVGNAVGSAATSVWKGIKSVFSW